MADINELNELYIKAQSALKAREYDQASAFLKRILLIDENYKDASRLLAQTVKLKRRRWYNDPRLWGSMIAIIVIGLLIWLVPKLSLPALFLPEPTPSLTATPTEILLPTETAVPTIIPSPTFIPPPLAWQRISIGQEFPRDTVTAIAFDPVDMDVIYVGTLHAGIYKTIDGGQSWQPAQNGLKRAEVSSLVIDPQDPQTLYAGVILGGVYKTTDGAQTWQAINNQIDVPGGPFLATVALDPTDRNHLYFTDSLGLYETMDGGENWAKLEMPSCPKIITSMVIVPTTPNTLYIADRENSYDCDLGIYRSRDGGATWEPNLMRTNILLQLLYQSLTIVPGPQERIFISGEVTGKGRLYRTVDDGKTWERLLEHKCDAMWIDPSQSGRIICASPETNQLLLSLDWGDTWNPILSDTSIRTISVSLHAEDTLIASGGESGLFLSTDNGATWSERNNGLGSKDLLLKLSLFDKSTLYAESGNRIYRSMDGGSNWNLLTDQGNGLAFDADGKMMYVLSDVLLGSNDNGKTWKKMTRTNQVISSFITHPLIPNLVVAVHPLGFSLSYDGGGSWYEGNNVAWRYETQDIVGTISTSLFPDQTGAHFYILVNGETTGKVFHLETATGAWYVCPLPETVTTINILAIDPRDSERVIISSPGNGLLISSDAGQSWRSSNTGLGSLFVNTIAMDPNTPDAIYAGTDGGAYASFDGGLTWGQINDGLLGATVVYSIVVDVDSNVYAATPYGIFKLER